MQRFSMGDAKSMSNPFSSHFKLYKKLCPHTYEKEEQIIRIHYTFAVSSVMFAMVCSRHNIANAISLVSRYMSNPRKGH